MGIESRCAYVASTVLGSRGSRWERLLRRPALVWAGALSYGI